MKCLNREPKNYCNQVRDMSGYKGMPFDMLERKLEESRESIYNN